MLWLCGLGAFSRSGLRMVFCFYKKNGRRKVETESLLSLSLLEYQEHSNKVSI